MRTVTALCAAALLSACYNPRFPAAPDGGTGGFLCFASDNPPCPTGLVCCVESRNGPLCGDDLKANDPTREGRCQLPPPPAMPTPWKDWDLGNKPTVVAATGDPMLTGLDENMVWRCPRDDGNVNPAAEIGRRFEPNDSILKALGIGSLAIGGTPPTPTGYEICPDKTAPTVPDVDVFKFRIIGNTAVKVVVDVKYQVTFGDLDVGLFREDLSNPMEKIPQKIMVDVTATNDACIIHPSLAPGAYYVAVRGAPLTAGEYNASSMFAINAYRIRIYGQDVNTPGTCSVTPTDMR